MHLGILCTKSMTDSAEKVVYSRLGNYLRAAGMAEIGRLSKEVESRRVQRLKQAVHRLLPQLSLDDAEPWVGIRPATASGVPIMGATPIDRVYVNSGHGTLGWTLACGSGAALADLLSERQPEVDFPFL